MENDSQKLREVEDDMHTREKALTIKANTPADTEMEKILDVVLQQWSTQVMKTLDTGEPGSAGVAGVGQDQANDSSSGGMQGWVGASKGGGTQLNVNTSARVEPVNVPLPGAAAEAAVGADGTTAPSQEDDGEADESEAPVPVAAGRIRLQVGLPFVREL